MDALLEQTKVWNDYLSSFSHLFGDNTWLHVSSDTGYVIFFYV